MKFGKWTTYDPANGILIGTCDQQFNGFGTFHKLSIRFALNKGISRRRRLARKGDGTDKGEIGDFGYTMPTGKCILKDANDKSCGDAKTGEGGFGFLVSLLTL